MQKGFGADNLTAAGDEGWNVRAAAFFRRCVMATVVASGGVLAASATQVGADSSQQVTYVASIIIPAPPASNFAGSGGGDGWAVAMTPTAVYNVFHHGTSLQVACHLQADATACWSPKTITDLGGHGFATSGQPGVWIDQGSGHLFVFGTRTSDNTAGVVCIDTTQPAGILDPFCGFTPLTNVGDAPLDGGISGTSDPVVVGSHWYSFNFVATGGTPTGTQDQLMCFDLAALAPCASQPFAVTLGGTSVNLGYPAPSIAAIGTQIVIPIDTSAGSSLACFNAASSTSCGGSFPIVLGFSYASFYGAAFPDLASNGTISGFCLATGTDQCYDQTGASISTPAGLAAVITGTQDWNGPAIVLGARVLVPNRYTNTVQCFDYANGATCPNYPKSFVNLNGGIYTVNPDPQRPTCIWVNGDSGSAQIQNFDAYSGGACGAGAIRVVASSVIPPQNKCIPSNYTSLQIVDPPRSGYTSGSVQFEDFDGNPLPTIPNQPLDANGSVNLTPLNLSTVSTLPQFVINLIGAAATTVTVKLTWVGTYSADCTSANVTATPPSIGFNGYRMAGDEGGVFDFGIPFAGSLANAHLNAPIIGIANQPGPNGYLLAGADGGVFALGGAPFFGSLGGHKLPSPIAAIAATPAGLGYWLVSQAGTVYNFGDAPSLPAVQLPGGTHIVGIASTNDGQGLWLTDTRGDIYTLGDAQYLGSLGGHPLNSPITAIAASANHQGYILAGADGGVFTFGVGFHGSAATFHLVGPIVGIALTHSELGYWLVGRDGGVFAFGDAPFFGSIYTQLHAGQTLNGPIVGIQHLGNGLS
jgi:hypothetical protein